MDDLLRQRSKTHGNWGKQAKVAVELKGWLLASAEETDLSPTQYEAISHICVKLSRIVCGDPNFKDHWDDIAGYAMLAAKECEEQQ